VTFFKKIRILPIGIFIVAIFLCNKLINFAFSFSENSETFLNNVSVAFAESSSQEKEKKVTESKKHEEKSDDSNNNVTVTEDNISQKVFKEKNFEEVILDYSNYKKKDEPDKLPFKVDYDQEEIELLEQLRQRREDLVKKEAELEKKEKLLQVTEVKIGQKISELSQLKSEIQQKIKTLNEEQERQIRSLVKTYESMKPKPAANIFNELELSVLIEIMERMKEAKKATIMAVMNPDRVTLVTSILATRKKIPL